MRELKTSEFDFEKLKRNKAMSAVSWVVYLLIMLCMGVFVVCILSGLYQLAYVLILAYSIKHLIRCISIVKSLRNGAYTAFEVDVEDCDIRFFQSYGYYRNNGDLVRVPIDSNFKKSLKAGLLIHTEKYDCLYTPKYIF